MRPSKAELFRRIGYTPHSSGQTAYHLSEARFRIPVCGRRYGKSTMAGVDKAATLFEPGVLGWIVGPTYDLGEKEFRVIWNYLIVKLKLGLDKRVRKAYNKRQGDMWIELPWGSRVEVRSATQPERLVGEKLNWAIMSEAAKHNKETWERFIRPALSDLRGSADFPTTPEGFNWLYELWQLGHDPTFPEYASWQFPSWTNPVVFPGGRNDPEILGIERTTAKEWFDQEYGADFSAFVGKIYSEFDESLTLRAHTFNPAWKNYIAWDWGYVNPMAAVEFQIDPWDNVYIWRVYYKSYTRLEVFIEEMKARPQPPGYRVDLMFGDAADPEAAASAAVKMGVYCYADPMAKENWRDGVNLVKGFLRPVETGRVLDEFGTPEMMPKLFIDPAGEQCMEVVREFNTYRVVDNLKSNTRESGSNSAAVKVDDHTLDAIRYALVSIYKLGATYSLADVLVAEGQRSDLVPQGGDTFFRENILLTTGLEF